MPAAAKEEMLASPNAEGIFSLAAGVAAALDTRDGANADRGEKSHQGIFSKNRRPRIGSTWLKWSGTHQDRSLAWSETMLGPTIYLYDGARLIEEADSSGNILARYAHSTEVDEPLSMLRGTVNSYYQNDGIGSITSLSNQTAALAGTYTFDSFGKLTASTGAITNPFRYTGREFDTETGIYYYRARYFDPGTGRFVSEDPIRFGGDGPDFYAYVNNDPTDFTDPLGLCCDVPAHPLDVSPEYNMAQSQANGYRWWFNTVGQWGGPWDYKNWGGQKHPEWDDFGNFNAGATACALHIPLWITLRGAGWAKQRRTPNDPDGSWWGTWPYGNDAHKQDEVMAGWNWCHDGCAQPNPQVGAAPLPGPSFSAPVDGGAPIPIEW